MYLKQPGFTYSACGPCTKNTERIEPFMKTGNTNFIYRNELDKACFQHDMAYQLANELHKPIVKKFKKRKVYSSFRFRFIWGVDLANMQSLSKYNKIIKSLLCVIDLFSKYAWVNRFKDKKGNSIVNAFKK